MVGVGGKVKEGKEFMETSNIILAHFRWWQFYGQQMVISIFVLESSKAELKFVLKLSQLYSLKTMSHINYQYVLIYYFFFKLV